MGPTKRSSPKPPGVKWMVMLSNGRIMGPYSTEAILKLISEGALTGDERIKKAVGGTWMPISKEAEFYDRLLEALHEAPQKNHLSETMSQETVIVPLPEISTEQTSPESEGNFDDTAMGPETKHRPHQDAPPLPAPSNASRPRPQVVDLQNLGTMEKKLKVRTVRMPLLLGGVALACLVGLFLMPSQDTDEKVRLIIPKYGHSETLSAADLKSAIQSALGPFYQDTFENYELAQSRLVSTLEKSPQSLVARGFLCLTYRELWPFTRQDSGDVEAINSLVKSTKGLDPIGPAGAYCEISKLLIFGKATDARGILDFLLNQQQFSTDPILIALKAEIMASEQDPRSAALFMETVKRLNPYWVKPSVLQGDFYMQAGQTQEAARSFQAVLQMNPKHKVAQIQYGILNYRFFKQTDVALNFLSGALRSKGRVSRQLLSKANFTVAQIYLDQKDNARAREFAQHAFDLNPADSEYKNLLLKLGGTTEPSKKAFKHNELVFLGDQYFRQGDCLSAQAEYKAAFELDPSNALAATKAARCLWQLNQTVEAINWLNKAVKADPRLTEAYVMQADYHTQRYNYQAAAQVLNAAARLFPNNNEVLRGYGLMEFRRNNNKDAINFLNRALKAYEGDIETLLLLAKAHGALGEYQQAQNYAIRAMELDSTNNEAIVVYAKNLVQFRGLEAGLYYIKDQISKFSYTIEFRIALAEMYRDVERYKDAQLVYEQILEADPKNKKAQLGVGECLQNQALFDRALRAYLNAAVLDPSDAEPLFKAGQLYTDMNRFEDSIKQFQRAIKVNPLFPRANYFAGRAALLNGDYQTALRFAEAERKVNPNLADSYILAAEVYSANKDFNKCATEYQQAVKLRPQGAEIYVKMARCYRQAGSPDIAASMLTIAATLESGLPDIYKEQGAIYEVKGDNRAAVQAYRKYRELSPNAPDRREIDSRIDSLDN